MPPAAWVLSLGLSYLVQDFTCSAAASAGAPPPESALLVVLTALNLILLLLTLLAGAGGLLLARHRRKRGGTQVLGFLGYVGAVLALVFSYGIVLIGLNPFVFEVCQ